MFAKLFLAFILVPVAEIYVLIKVGSFIGAMNTVICVILTAFAGAALARHQGARTMLRIQENLNQGIMPAEEMIDAFLIFGAGLVLLTPGFITDIFGLLLLFPPSRRAFKRWLRKKFDHWIQNKNVNITYYR